jgi:hypothetical protein
MHEVQDSILSLAFSRQIPKSISDKIDNHLEKLADKDDKRKNGKQNGGGNGNGNNQDGKKNQDLLYNSDKSNPNGISKKVKTSQKFSITNRRSVPRLPMES